MAFRSFCLVVSLPWANTQVGAWVFILMPHTSSILLKSWNWIESWILWFFLWHFFWFLSLLSVPTRYRRLYAGFDFFYPSVVESVASSDYCNILGSCIISLGFLTVLFLFFFLRKTLFRFKKDSWHMLLSYIYSVAIFSVCIIYLQKYRKSWIRFRKNELYSCTLQKYLKSKFLTFQLKSLFCNFISYMYYKGI